MSQRPVDECGRSKAYTEWGETNDVRTTCDEKGSTMGGCWPDGLVQWLCKPSTSDRWRRAAQRSSTATRTPGQCELCANVSARMWGHRRRPTRVARKGDED